MKKSNFILTSMAAVATLAGAFAFKPHAKQFSPLFTDQARSTCNVVACFTTGSLSNPGSGCPELVGIQVYTSPAACEANRPWTISRTVTE
jgi:hypothetical protein